MIQKISTDLSYFIRYHAHDIVSLVINLPSRDHYVIDRNSLWFDIYHHGYRKVVHSIKIKDSYFEEMTRNTIRFDNQEKDQVHIIFIPEKIISKEGMNYERQEAIIKSRDKSCSGKS